METERKFNIGDSVNVDRCIGDLFQNNFSGYVVGYHGDFVIVEDQDGDCWDCEESQVSFSSDKYM